MSRVFDEITFRQPFMYDAELSIMLTIPDSAERTAAYLSIIGQLVFGAMSTVV